MGEAKKSAKQGRNKFKCDDYKKKDKLVYAKLANVLRSNGPAQALVYAEKHGLFAQLRRLGRKAPVAFAKAIETDQEFRKFIKSGA